MKSKPPGKVPLGKVPHEILHRADRRPVRPTARRLLARTVLPAMMTMLLLVPWAAAYGQPGGGPGPAGGPAYAPGSYEPPGYGAGTYPHGRQDRDESEQSLLDEPLVSLPLMVLILLVYAFGGKLGDQVRRTQVVRRGRMALGETSRGKAVGQLKREDPRFDEQRFYDRIDQAFVKIQNAWSRQEPASVRAFISDGIHERFALQAKEQQDFGYRYEVQDVTVRRMVLAQVHQDTHFQLVTVRIDATRTRYRVSLADGRYLAGPREPVGFAEYWSFLRRRGVQTADKPGLIEGNCPNCGAGITVNQHARCQACDSLLRSGQFDWVLAEITLECEWVDALPDEITGVAHYQAMHDPGFNVQHLEDLASVIFWRKAMADRLGNVAPLAKVSTPEFVESYRKRLDPQDGVRSYYGDCTVGSVEMRGLITGPVRDRILVEVRWAGRRYRRNPAGPPQWTGDASTYRHMLVLVRNTSVTSQVNLSVSSSHCPHCGAPEADLISNACQFCGEVLNDGSHDWLLAEIVASASDRARELLRDSRNVETQVQAGLPRAAFISARREGTIPHGTELLMWSIHAALADNQLDAREVALIEKVARRRKVPREQLETLIAAARHGTLEAPEPANREQARHWLTVLSDVCLSDGRIDKAEWQLLCQVAAPLEMNRYDIRHLLRQRRAALYRAARARLKDTSGPATDRREQQPPTD